MVIWAFNPLEKKSLKGELISRFIEKPILKNAEKFIQDDSLLGIVGCFYLRLVKF